MSESSVFERQLRKKRKTGVPRLMEIAGTKAGYLVAACALGVVAVVTEMKPYVTIYRGLLIFLDGRAKGFNPIWNNEKQFTGQ
jgi:hypothetical protein